jgi:nucleoside phosphorylase
MKKQLFTILALLICLTTFAQFTTGTVTLTTAPLMTVKIDTDATTTTLTLVGPSNTWLGIGFGATSMGNIDDYFIWSSAVNRDYSADPNDGYNTPMPDTTESWTIDSDIVVSTTRTIIAKRTSTSSGDYTFANTNSSIPIVYARGTTSQSFAKHGPKGGKTLTRTALGVEDFSLNTAAIYPNPY